jgi:two-component system chemotaxis response regulator CheY
MSIVPEHTREWRGEMYTIGELSKIVKISIDALRYYDEIGLLKPHHIDSTNRYRYYTAEQVNEIITIMEWKQYGFSLNAISEFLHCTDLEQIRSVFQMRLQELSAERSSIERSFDLLQERIRNMEGELTMTKKTVLIIDDSAFLRDILTDILEKHGFTVLGAATDGETGIALFNKLKPDAILLDIGLPDIDGIQVARKITEMDYNAKIVMCSARGQLHTILESLKAGASHFVVKPFLPEAMLESINTALESAQRYEPETISSIQADNRAGEIGDPISQKMINDLLDLCMKGYSDNSPEMVEFWDNLMLLQPIPPLLP